MNNHKKYLTGCIISGALMFAWIFLTVLLTGGREIEDFTTMDTYIFMAFIAVEIITFICCFYFGIKLGKESHKNNPSQLPILTEPNAQPTKRGGIMAVCAFVIALISMISGIIVFGNSAPDVIKKLETLFSFCIIIPIFAIALNPLIKALLNKILENKKVESIQNYIISHREFAEKTSKQKFLTTNIIRYITDLYAVLICILAFLIAFCSGVLFETDWSVPLCFYSAFLFLSSFSRIRFSPSKDIFEEDKSYVNEKDYPEIYKTIEKAKTALNCKGEVKFAITPDCNAGIAKIGNIYSVQLGAVLLNTLSQEEIYNILLHEFAHIKNNNAFTTKSGAYYIWLDNGKTPHYLSFLTELLFCCFEYVFSFQFNLYLYASSIINETNADKAMAVYGNANHSASALVKIKYFELFGWENVNSDEKCYFEQETPDVSFISDTITTFKEAVPIRANDWNRLIESEILSRSATHPTLKMRLENLGVSTPEVLNLPDSDKYTEECKKTLNHIEKLIYDDRVKNYEEYKKLYYTEPKALIDAWENAGKPVIAEEYADIHNALHTLGRVTDAYNLCEKAISVLSPTAACYAYYANGSYLLHNYDDKGIDYIYKAIENNSNYINVGLNIIGEYCCLTGKANQLEAYRKRAIELTQLAKDKYNLVNTLNEKDRLTAENLPQELFDGIMNYILSIDTDRCIDNIYLFRKTITDDFFSSVFVIKFSANTNDVIKNNIMHKLFCYLDTCSEHQFSLFDYAGIGDVKINEIPNSCVYSKNQ